jgi:hypothetical protein
MTMNSLTVVLFAILLLVSTQPEAQSQNAVAEAAIVYTGAASGPDGQSPAEVAPLVVQPEDKTVAEAQPALDVTQNFLQNRLAVASYHLRERFLSQ